jgi:hypothetical protein
VLSQLSRSPPPSLPGVLSCDRGGQGPFITHCAISVALFSRKWLEKTLDSLIRLRRLESLTIGEDLKEDSDEGLGPYPSLEWLGPLAEVLRRGKWPNLEELVLGCSLGSHRFRFGAGAEEEEEEEEDDDDEEEEEDGESGGEEAIRVSPDLLVELMRSLPPTLTRLQLGSGELWFECGEGGREGVKPA